MTENEIAKTVVDACFQIHTRLGPGLLETVYEKVLAYELRQRGFQVSTQVSIPIVYDNLKFDEGFRGDLVVNNKVLLELKSIEHITAIHHKQLLTYLRLTDMKLGLLINFGSALMKDGITRIVNGLED